MAPSNLSDIKTDNQQSLCWNPGNQGEPAIGVLSNPLSGGNKRGLDSIKKLLKNRPEVLHREARNPAEVNATLAAFSQAGIKLLVINGGDGTIQAVMTSIFTRKLFADIPILAVLKAGTTSMTAGDIGLPGRGNKALSKLLFQLKTSREIKIVQRPVLEVQHDNKTSRFGMFFGAAVIPQGIDFFHQRINRHGLRGELGPGLVMIRFLLAILGFQRQKILRPIPMTIHLNQQHEANRNDFLIVLISTLERLFFGLHPYWGEEDGPLHFTSVTSRSRHILRTIFQLTRGQRPRYATQEHGYQSHNVKQIKIICASPYTLDGQIYHPADDNSPIIVRHGGTLSFVHLQP
jgi:diacylglycerol kinase family enzyme